MLFRYRAEDFEVLSRKQMPLVLAESPRGCRIMRNIEMNDFPVTMAKPDEERSRFETLPCRR